MTGGRPGPGSAGGAGDLVAMRGIWKRFGRVVANADVDFDLRAGEIHALLGENGAGKTTLMNILYGLLRPDAGSIALEGRPVRLRSPQDAVRLGIGMVHQHFMLVPTLTVAENMVLGDRDGRWVRVPDLRDVARRLEVLGERYGLSVSPEAPVWQLSVGEQQRVEILRALYRNARVLILDEPTATLTPMEVDHLLARVRALAEDGAGVVIITHHLDEVMAWADRVTVLRRGRNVATLRPGDTSAAELARLMVGREVALETVASRDRPTVREPAPAGPAGAPAPAPEAALATAGLQALNDRGQPALVDVSLEVRPGEIVAIAGVEGNGQAELEETVVGIRPATGGAVLLGGRDVTREPPEARLRAGLRYIPSDRYRRGLVRGLAVAENLFLDRVDRPPFGSRFTLRRRTIFERAVELIRRFGIQVRGPGEPAGTLSGGNAQRVVLARALSWELKALLAAQPTRGLDVGAIEFVWDQLRRQRDAGAGILLISTDLDEVMALADRCHVMYRGRLVAHWSRGELDRERIGLAMGGVVGSEEVGTGGR